MMNQSSVIIGNSGNTQISRVECTPSVLSGLGGAAMTSRNRITPTPSLCSVIQQRPQQPCAYQLHYNDNSLLSDDTDTVEADKLNEIEENSLLEGLVNNNLGAAAKNKHMF